ncbi:MAG: N4-gp56 family major capsid protein [Planctomycetota bacterium]|nr:N4-gp56 family major capsid protein [Planctomycetota bacterium]
MAGPYTVSSGAPLEEVVVEAYSKATELAFLPNLYFAQFAQSKRWDLNRAPVAGDTVVFTIYNNLAPKTEPLSDEYSDIDRVNVTVAQKSIELKEYGNVVTVTNRLRVTAFDNIDLAVARVVGANMANSVDLIARGAYDEQQGANYVTYVGGGSGASDITSDDIITAEYIRKVYVKLERANVPKFDGGFYIAILHPDVIYDLRNEGYGTSTNVGTWRAPREYCDPEELYNGEVGSFEGFRIISSSNCQIQDGAGGDGCDVYTSYFVGYQAVAYAEGQKPGLRITGPTDNLGRTLNIGWYGLFGFGELRPEALHKVFSASSVA